tara:strand:+ start:1720 stop:2109 length:390 start_codon:yes stop_codon:yes gene_type:complete
MVNKIAYTKLFLKELGQSSNEEAIKEYLPLWWKNTRDKKEGGLRLTEAGYDILEKINLHTYTIPYPKEMPLTTQVIIYLDKFIDCPYFLTNKYIIVTNEKKAVELTLFSGDVRKYGLRKAMTRSKKEND